MYKKAPAEPIIEGIPETYLGPGQGIVGRIFAFTDRYGRALVDSGDQKGVLKGSSNKGYNIRGTIRFEPGKSRLGSIPLTDRYCEIDPITGIPINAQDNSTYEGTIGHVSALGRILVYVIPSLESRKLGGSKTLLENANPDEYQIGKLVGYIKKLGTNDKSDNYWIIESEEKKDNTPQINNSSIDIALLDQINDRMLILSQDATIPNFSQYLSVMERNTVKLNGIDYIAFLTDDSRGNEALSDLGYPSNMIAKGDYSQPKLLHQRRGDNTQLSFLDVAGMTPKASNVSGKKQKLERLVRSESRKLGIQL